VQKKWRDEDASREELKNAQETELARLAEEHRSRMEAEDAERYVVGLGESVEA